MEIDASHPGAIFLAEYQQRMMLAEMGYRFDPRELSEEMAAIFRVISAEYRKQAMESAKKG